MRIKHKQLPAILVWLCVICLAFLPGRATAQKEISSMEELEQALQRSDLRSDEVEILEITKEGILVTQKITFSNKGSYLLKGGPLIRSREFYNTMIVLEEGCHLEIQNELQGNLDVIADAVLLINKNASATLSEGGWIWGVNGSGHALAAMNLGTFTLDGGAITNCTGESSEVIMSSGKTYLKKGRIVDFNADRVVYGKDIYLSPSLVTIKGTYSNTFFLETPLNLCSAFTSNVSTEVLNVKVGQVVVNGSDGYTLTESDVEKLTVKPFRFDGEIQLGLQNNQIVVTQLIEDNTMTEEKLQRLINQSNGTTTNPAVIEIPAEGVTLTKQIKVTNTHIKLTGGSIRNGSKDNIFGLFTLASSSIILENITIEGGYDGTSQIPLCAFFVVNKGSSLTMNQGAILKGGYFGGDFGAVVISNGSFIMNDGEIRNNRLLDNEQLGSRGELIRVGGGSFTMNGGTIKENKGLGHYTVNVLGNSIFTHNGGTIGQNEGGSIHINGDIILASKKQEHAIGQPLAYASAKPILFGCPLTYKLSFDEQSLKSIVKGRMELIKGNGYQLAASDLANLMIPAGYKLKLESNSIYITSNLIDTQENLQEAINAATGTASNPTIIQLAGEVSVGKTIEVGGKHIVLKGGKLINKVTTDFWMINVKSGSLRLEEITLDGNQGETKGYCSLIAVSEGDVEILSGTLLTNSRARGTDYALIPVFSGNLLLNGGEISGNTVEESLICIMSKESLFEMRAGKITKNKNAGSGLMRLIKVFGKKTILSGGVISENQGDRVGIQSTCPIQLDENFGLEELVLLDKGGYLALTGAPKATVDIAFAGTSIDVGTVVATGSGYTLTTTDLNRLHLVKGIEGVLRLEGNNTITIQPQAAVTYPITIRTIRGGKLTASAEKAKKDELVTITVTPDKGMKLHAYMLRYNTTGRMEAGSNPNTYTFRMPASEATITAEFILDNAHVEPMDTTGLVPGVDPTPEISSLDSLIQIVGGGKPITLTPVSKACPKDQLPDPVIDMVNTATTGGDQLISSMTQLLGIVSSGTDGKKEITALPAKITMTMKLPSSQRSTNGMLRTATNRYYFITERNGKAVRIDPVYDADNHLLTYRTGHLGVVVLMYENSSTSNEHVEMPEGISVHVAEGNLHVNGLAAGQTYVIRNISGRIICGGKGNGSNLIVGYLPQGIYLFSVDKSTVKVNIRR